MANSSDERIETYINRSGVAGDTAFMLEQLNELNDAFNKVNSIKLTLGKDTSFKAAIDSAGQLKATTDGLAKSVDNFSKIQAQALAVSKEVATSFASQGDAASKQAADLATVKLALQQNNELQKQYKKQLDEGSLSLEQYQEKTAKAILTQKEYQASISSLNKELSNAAKASLPGNAPVNDPLNAGIPFTANTGNSEEEQAALAKTGQAVNDLEKDEAAAAIAANEWATSQRAATSSATETGSAAIQALSPLEQSAQVLAEYKLELNANVAAQKDLAKQFVQGKVSQDEYVASTAQAIIRQNELKVSIAALNKELSTSARQDLAVPGSQNAADAENAALIAERRNIPLDTTDPQEIARRQEINNLLDKNNALIDQNSSLLERQKINIGNYPKAFTDAFNTLDTELGKVTTSLQAEGLSGKQIADLSLKQEALKNATALVNQEFSTTNAQAGAFKESAKQIGQAYGTDSEVFKTYAAQVAAGTVETKKIGDAVEQAGGKSNVFVTGFKGIYNTLRQVAQAIPGIGLAGLIGLLLTPLASLAASLFNVGNKAVDLKDKQAVLNDEIKKTDEVLKGLGETAGKGVLEVDNLKVHIEQAKQGLVSQNDVVALYNTTIGKTTGAVHSLAEAEQGLIDNGAAYIKFTFLKAAAQVAATKASDEAVQAEITRQKNLKDFANAAIDTHVSAFGSTSFDAAEFDRETARIEQARKDRQAKEAKIHDDASSTYLRVEKTFLDQLNDLSKQKGFNPDGDKIKEQNEADLRAIDIQIQALTRYENKQEEVLSFEQNTYEKRRQALVNFNNAQTRLVELNAQRSRIGVTNTNQLSVIAAKEQTDLQQVALQGYDKLRALDESYRVRKLTAQEQIAEDEINASARANEAIYKDDTKSMEERLAAYKAYVEAEQDLYKLQYETRLKNAGFSPQEISDYENGLQVQLQGKKITNEELIALSVDYNTKNTILASQGARQIYEITLSSAKKLRADVTSLNKTQADNSVADQYSKELAALNASYTQRKISVDQYLSDLATLNQKFEINQLQAQIDASNRKLAAEKEADAKLKAEKADAQADLTNAENIGNPQEIDENQARLDALVSQEQEASGKIKAIEKELADYKIALGKKTSEQQQKIDLARQQLEIQILQKSVDGIAGLIDARYDNEKAQIQTTIDEINQKAQADIDAENATSDNAQQKAKVIAEINGRAAAEAQQLQDKQKQLDIQKAQFDKEKAIADIIINTAVGISAAYRQGPTGIATIPLIAALGAVEIALVEAQQLPHYKYGAGINGLPKHPGGDSVVGDGGKHELAITPSGQLIVTPDEATVMNFPKDTMVLPDADVAINALINNSLRGLGIYDQPEPDREILKATQQLIRENRRLQTIIANKQETHFHGSWAGWEAGYRSGGNWTRWVDEHTKF